MPPTEPTRAPPHDTPVPLLFLFWTFLKIGAVAFGGFMALIAVIERVIVERHQLVRHEEMLDAISLSNLLPGPQAVNVVVYVGHRLRGWRGALAAACGVLAPTFILMVSLTWIYFTYGDLPAMGRFFQGITPAMAAIIFSVALGMGRKGLTGRPTRLIALAAALLLILFRDLYVTLALIAAAALIGRQLFIQAERANDASGERPPFPWRSTALSLTLLGALVALSLIPLPLENDGLPRIGLTFGGLSLMLFGGGYVFIPMIQDVVVGMHGWVTTREFIDGVAMGQVTPGPILITAAFVGQKVMMLQPGGTLTDGLVGALVATLAIYTPPALLMITAARALHWLRHSAATRAAMRGIRAAVIGMIGAASVVIAQTLLPAPPMGMAINDFLTSGTLWGVLLPSLAILVGALIALLRFKADVVVVIPLAGLLGLLLY